MKLNSAVFTKLNKLYIACEYKYLKMKIIKLTYENSLII
jgi:hypothetical protein